MKDNPNIIDVTEADFEYEVVAFSGKTPVVVDYWAEWCAPCRVIGPLLERLAQEAGGAFRLAKINVDENQNLARRFNVRSIPAVKAFSQGQVVDEFVGNQPEPKVREFIRNLVGSQTDLLLEKAHSLLRSQQWAAAEQAYRASLDENPESPAGRLGLVKTLLVQGRPAEAKALMQDFPASRELAAIESLRPLANALERFLREPSFSDDALEAAYGNSLRLATRGNLQAAMDGLLEVLRQDKHFRNDEARRLMLALFEILGNENPVTREYRNELASVLF